MTLFKLGSLSPWCLSQNSESLVITYSSVRWAKTDLHILREKQANGTENKKDMNVNGKFIYNMTSDVVTRAVSFPDGLPLLEEAFIILLKRI